MLIDKQLIAAGWVVQDKKVLNLFAAQGVAVRESMAAGHGRADYLLYVDKSAVGVIEAKPEGTPFFLYLYLRVLLVDVTRCPSAPRQAQTP